MQIRGAEGKEAIALMACFFFFSRQEDVSRHESEARGARPSPAVLHRHGHRARGQQEIQVVLVGEI